jgi:hypothetical protein
MSGGGEHFSGGGAHFGGGGNFSAPAPHFNASPRFAAPAPHFNSAAPRFNAPAPRYNAAAPNWRSPGARGYYGHGPSYPSSSHGTVTARAGSPGRAPIEYGRFANGRGGQYGYAHGGHDHDGDFHHHWDGGYWHGHYWPPVYYRPGFSWFLPILPAYCVTYWWGGVPYYYYNEAYYTWDPNDSGYVATEPPPVADGGPSDDGAAPGYPDAAPPDSNYGVTYGTTGADGQNADASDPNAAGYSSAPAYNGAPADAAGNLYAYPKNGQSPEQQAEDRRECAQWAASQSPDSANGGSSMDYRRALTACLSGRGYSVD